MLSYSLYLFSFCFYLTALDRKHGERCELNQDTEMTWYSAQMSLLESVEAEGWTQLSNLVI